MSGKGKGGAGPVAASEITIPIPWLVCCKDIQFKDGRGKKRRNLELDTQYLREFAADLLIFFDDISIRQCLEYQSHGLLHSDDSLKIMQPALSENSEI